jgi:tRNA modification GTPase
MRPPDELIVAPATPAGGGGRAIVRLSGDGLRSLLETLCDAVAPGFVADGCGDPPRVVAARLAAAGLGREWGGVPLEVLHWPGPGGPTGGPLAELQLPGSGPLVDAVVAEACRLGARLARGGEFTLRAFLTGRLDLVAAEAVLAVVDARTPEELSRALDRMAGGAGRRLRDVRNELLDVLADIEAAIDFADETTPDAVPVVDAAAWCQLAARLAGADAVIGAAAADLGNRDVAAAAGLPRVVLVGPPNIGKSSLFNAIVGRAAALVADESGTTRDWLEARLDGSARWVLVDLAGLAGEAEWSAAEMGDEVGDDPGAAAQAAARAEIARADVLVVCRDAAEFRGRADESSEIWAGPREASLPGRPRIDVWTRCDRAGPPAAVVAGIATSIVSGAGLAALRAAIDAAVAALPPRESPATLRLKVGLDAARAALGPAIEGCRVRGGGGSAGAVRHAGLIDEAIVAGQVRAAAAALGEVTGAEIGPDLIDRIFSRHCIGK